MNVLILGANGMLGPHVTKSLEEHHTLRLTDINAPPDTPHEYFKLDVSDLDAVIEAADGMDAIVNLSVLRPDRQIAFDVNARGTYNACAAAVHHGIRRVINTGPHFTITGPTYENSDHLIGPDVPSQSGTLLYAITKSLGQEICRVFTENHDLYVLTLLFYNFHYGNEVEGFGKDFTPFNVTWKDAGEAFCARVEHSARITAVEVRAVLHICGPAAWEVHQRESKTHSGLAPDRQPRRLLEKDSGQRLTPPSELADTLLI